MRRKQGFTLVELLVVIGIIAVLIGILLPALGRAQRAAKVSQCLSNQRQLILALMMYCQENKGTFPGGSGMSPYRDANGNPQAPTYFLKLANYDTDAFNPYSCNQDEQSGPTYLAKYVSKSKKLTQCPEAPEIKDTGTNNLAVRTSYWYPMSLVYTPMEIWTGTAANPTPPVQTPQKLSKVKYASDKVVIIDFKTYHVKPVVDTDKTFDGSSNATGKIDSKRAMVAAGFADGHVAFRSVFEMYDSDVNWTGRFNINNPATYAKGQAGIAWKDFR